MSNSATPWTAACQASLSFTILQSLLKWMSIESVMLSNHLIHCCPLLFLPSIFPSTRVFSNKEMTTHSSILVWRIPGTEEPGGLPSMGLHRVGHDWSDLAAAAMSWLFLSGGHCIGASASVLPMNSQGWFPLRLTGLISLQETSKGLTPKSLPRDSQESSLALQFESINSLALSLLYGTTLTYVHDYWKNYVSPKSLHLCSTLCNPMDCSLPGSSVHGILQAGILEWVAMSFSRGIFLEEPQLWPYGCLSAKWCLSFLIHCLGLS